MLRHKTRHEVFLLEYPKAEQKVYEELLAASRVSLTEHYLLSAVRSADSDALNIEASKTLINNQLKSWSTVGIKCTDLHPRLWAFAQQITAGKQPH